MKKPLKILVPLLLALLIIASLAWYLFVYDPSFTRDMLLRHARSLEEKGDHNAAAWFYNQAYAQSGNGEDVAIELADQFKSIGNYTKAEYTLSNAIKDGPSAKLYTALCKTYVEQDKLLDAVNMLSNVSDPAIRAELDALRPAAPTASPDPGFYSQYISVTIEAESGTLYVTTDGEYPSTAGDLYTDPITLPAGETMIYALAVGENGLVSELAVYGYTVGGVVEPAVFADPAVEAEARRILGLGEDEIIYTNQLWTITEFTMPADATFFDDLAMMPYLKKLTIHDNDSPLNVLSSLSNLEYLDLTGCAPTRDELAIIAALPNLTALNLSDCGLSSIANLEGAARLQSLDLRENSIRNLSIITSMTSLKTLYLQNNAVTGLDALSGMVSLETLDISYNSVTDTSPLTTCNGLTELNVSHNLLEALTGIDGLKNLAVLEASDNQITDVALLAACTALTELDIAHNSIEDISALAALTKLERFDFSYNAVTVLPAWPKDCALVEIDGSHNQIDSVEPLRDFQSLNKVTLDYNLLTTVDPLAECPALMVVNVYGNEIPDVSALKEHSIVVNYTPITE